MNRIFDLIFQSVRMLPKIDEAQLCGATNDAMKICSQNQKNTATNRIAKN